MSHGPWLEYCGSCSVPVATMLPLTEMPELQPVADTVGSSAPAGGEKYAMQKVKIGE